MNITIVFKSDRPLNFEHCFGIKILDNEISFTDNRLILYKYKLSEITNLFIY